MGEDGWSRKQFWAREVPRKEAPVCVCVCVHCTQTRGRRYWEFSYLISYIERFWEERPAFYRVSQKKVYNKLDRGRKKHLVSRCLARDQRQRSEAGKKKNLQELVCDLFSVPPPIHSFRHNQQFAVVDQWGRWLSHIHACFLVDTPLSQTEILSAENKNSLQLTRGSMRWKIS